MIQPPLQVVDTCDRGVHFEEGTVFAFFSYSVTLRKFQSAVLSLRRSTSDVFNVYKNDMNRMK
jgi:hypothetical protein